MSYPSDPMKDTIHKVISEALPSATVHVLGDDGEHFGAVVISADFEGLPLIRQHRLVMDAMKEELAERVHALQLKTFTPERWETARHEYNL